MTENFQNENQSTPNFAQPETQAPVPQSMPTQRPNVGGVSRLFKIGFVIAGMLVCLLFGPYVLNLSSIDGYEGLGIGIGVILVWGISVAGLLFTAFLKGKLPSKAVSVIFGAAMGAQVALLLVVAIFAVTSQRMPLFGARLLPIAAYVLVTVPIWLFVRYIGREVVHSADGHAAKTGNFGVISLILGLFLSLGSSWIAYPDFHIDRLGPKSPELIEYEKCLARSAPGEYNSEGCLTPNDPHVVGFPPQTFGFPIHSANLAGDLTSFYLYFFVIIPNWLVWSMAVYLLLSVGSRFKSRGSQNV